jgi:hypothetical protein
MMKVKQIRILLLTSLARALSEVSTDATPRYRQPPPALSVLDTGQKTRRCALAALVMSAFSFTASGWLLYALATNVEALKNARVIPTFDAKYDAVAAAAAVGRLDVLSMVLTFLGIIAAIGVLYGWSAFRAAAVRAAIEELENRLPSEVRDYMALKGAIAVGRALEDAELLARLQARFTALGLDDSETATLIDDDPAFREERDDD